MKRIILITASILAFTMGYSQTVRKDSDGNYIAVSAVRDSLQGGKATGKTLLCSDGKKLPVYESKNGKLHVIRISKASGKSYKFYLKFD